MNNLIIYCLIINQNIVPREYRFIQFGVIRSRPLHPSHSFYFLNSLIPPPTPKGGVPVPEIRYSLRRMNSQSFQMIPLTHNVLRQRAY